MNDSQKYKNWYGFCKLMKIGAKTHTITSFGRREYLKIVVRVDDLLLVQLVVLISYNWNLRGVSFCTPELNVNINKLRILTSPYFIRFFVPHEKNTLPMSGMKEGRGQVVFVCKTGFTGLLIMANSKILIFGIFLFHNYTCRTENTLLCIIL